MGPGLLCLVSVIYAYVAFEYLQAGRHGMAVAFWAYAMANVGFVIDWWVRS